MIILGAILLILALVVPALNILLWPGIILLIVGAALAVMGGTGHPVGTRRHWY